MVRSAGRRTDLPVRCCCGLVGTVGATTTGGGEEIGVHEGAHSRFRLDLAGRYIGGQRECAQESGNNTLKTGKTLKWGEVALSAQTRNMKRAWTYIGQNKRGPATFEDNVDGHPEPIT